eukprot:Blabericola_migrator_1__8995@NODE_478_length_8196_cov_107_510026_g372_i0_p4_GENE_NODE_478_length_8196_cov_107_510026_g372_i0NODE_478_length_8196_cov_107_510026_g372_i0_p4_ORF_typecomplete_len185_score31_67_NODE_478_length_8196_cov_107_510026_g372_i072887842
MPAKRHVAVGKQATQPRLKQMKLSDLARTESDSGSSCIAYSRSPPSTPETPELAPPRRGCVICSSNRYFEYHIEADSETWYPCPYCKPSNDVDGVKVEPGVLPSDVPNDVDEGNFSFKYIDASQVLSPWTLKKFIEDRTVPLDCALEACRLYRTYVEAKLYAEQLFADAKDKAHLVRICLMKSD